MTRAKKPAARGLELHLLGPLAASQNGRGIELPASRKARALLAYLALMPCAMPRARLCALLFDTASDPRGELRWYLSKLRGILGARRIRCDDDSVRLDLADSFVDALELQRAARRDFATLTMGRAEALQALFRGDFLEGMELDRCPGFMGWLLTQRRRFQACRIELFHRLVKG